MANQRVLFMDARQRVLFMDAPPSSAVSATVMVLRVFLAA